MPEGTVGPTVNYSFNSLAGVEKRVGREPPS